MVWTTPIIDRTQSDVDYALLNQNSNLDLKGAFNISDANRIIENTIYIRDLLVEYGYTVPSLTTQPLFIETDLPYVNSKISVMKDNIQKVVNAFYKNGHPTILYGTVLDYNGVNAMELNLKLTNDFLQSMILSILRCGNAIVGQSINL